MYSKLETKQTHTHTHTNTHSRTKIQYIYVYKRDKWKSFFFSLLLLWEYAAYLCVYYL